MGENKEKTKIVGPKGKLGIMAKILTVVIIPIVVMILVAGVSLEKISVSVSENVAEHTLKAIVTLYDQIYTDQKNSTEFEVTCAAIAVDTHVDMFFDHNGTISMSSMSGLNGTQFDDSIVKKLDNNGEYFDTNGTIKGETYYIYYKDVNTKGIYGKNELIMAAAISKEYIKSFFVGRIIASVVIVAIIGALAVIIVGAIIILIVKAIKSVVANLDQVAKGELNLTMTEKMVGRTDEVGTIARAVQSLVTDLAKTFTNVLDSTHSLNDFSGKFQDSFQNINESISNVNVAIEGIATGATSQAQETQDVANQMNSMGEAIGATTESVEDLMASTKGMKESNRQMDATLHELADISVRTKESIDEVHRQTNDTNASAEQIRNVVDIISDIASQTNLLSLNASIEAARAGEQGKGFAVVADEVRNLAEQSANSAQQISDIVEQLIEKSNTSVSTMEGVLGEIERQDEKISSTLEAFDQLNVEIENVSEAITNISGQVDSINQSKTVVMEGLESLAAIAEENAASTEETSASMAELEIIVNECNQATGELVSLADGMVEDVSHFQI